MTDREQIRRDAEAWAGSEADTVCARNARHSLDLLAELEQAEKDWQRWERRALVAERRAEQAERERDDAIHGRDLARLDTKAEQARLAAVPALVEELRNYLASGVTLCDFGSECDWPDECEGCHPRLQLLRDALAAWEKT